MSDEREVQRAIDAWIDREISRRKLLRQAGAGALGLSLAGFLAACGDGGIEGGGGEKAQEKVIPKGPIAKNLSISNWPLYIDVNEKTKKRPTLQDFQKKYGTKVKYT